LLAIIEKKVLSNKLPRERLALIGIGVLLAFALGYAFVKGQRRPAPIVFENVGPAKSSSADKSTIIAQNTPASPAPDSNAEIIVHAAGAVKKPGVVHLPAGARVDDAVKAAGGATANADLEAINLAAKLIDGTQVYIPRKGEATKTHGSSRDSDTPAAHRAPASEIRGERDPVFKGGTVAPPYQPVTTTLPPPDQVSITPDSSPTTDSSDQGKTSRQSRSKKEPPSEPVDLNTATSEDLQKIPGIGPVTAQRILDYRNEHGQFNSIDELTAVKGIGEKKLEAMRKYLRL